MIDRPVHSLIFRPCSPGARALDEGIAELIRLPRRVCPGCRSLCRRPRAPCRNRLLVRRGALVELEPSESGFRTVASETVGCVLVVFWSYNCSAGFTAHRAMDQHQQRRGARQCRGLSHPAHCARGGRRRSRITSRSSAARCRRRAAIRSVQSAGSRGFQIPAAASARGPA